jgi:hypothetical protein
LNGFVVVTVLDKTMLISGPTSLVSFVNYSLQTLF